MPLCPKCGNKVSKTDKFCFACGAKLEQEEQHQYTAEEEVPEDVKGVLELVKDWRRKTKWGEGKLADKAKPQQTIGNKTPTGTVITKGTDRKQLKDFMAKDEKVEQILPLRRCQVCATNKRLFITTDEIIRAIDYHQISSVEYSSKKSFYSKRLFHIGIILLIVGAILFGLSVNGSYPHYVEYNLFVASMILPVPGASLLFLGIFPYSETVVISVAGIDKPITLRGNKQQLRSLVQIINQQTKLPSDSQIAIGR